MEEAVQVEEVVETPVESTPEALPQESAQEQKAFVDSMLEQITDEEIKTSKMWDALKGKDANELGKYIKELKSFTGKKGDIPKEDASQEEWDAFYSKLGRPESPEGYDFAMNDEFKQLVGAEAPFFESAIEGFKEQAYALGASPEKAEALIDWYLDKVATQINESREAMNEFNEKQDAELRKEWGANYDGLYDANKAMLKRFGADQDTINELDSSGVLRNPVLAKTLAKINKEFADDPQIGHMQTTTMSGIRDQLEDVNSQIADNMKKGVPNPAHLLSKRIDLMNKLGENL